jgi:predicted acyl esterase
MLAEASSWLDLTLGVPGAKALDPRPIAISPESWSGAPVRLASLPAVRRTSFALAGASSIVASGKVQRSTPRLKAPLEVFGAPTVTVRANAVDGWSRLVAILSARTPAGAEIVVAGGGVPTRPGSRSYRIVLGNQATFVPRGSRLTLTLASSSLAQNPGNLLYLDLPMAAGARVTVGPARIVVPALTKPVSR